jgi:hypothetical protein
VTQGEGEILVKEVTEEFAHSEKEHIWLNTLK